MSHNEPLVNEVLFIYLFTTRKTKL